MNNQLKFTSESDLNWKNQCDYFLRECCSCCSGRSTCALYDSYVDFGFDYFCDYLFDHYDDHYVDLSLGFCGNQEKTCTALVCKDETNYLWFLSKRFDIIRNVSRFDDKIYCLTPNSLEEPPCHSILKVQKKYFDGCEFIGNGKKRRFRIDHSIGSYGGIYDSEKKSELFSFFDVDRIDNDLGKEFGLISNGRKKIYWNTERKYLKLYSGGGHVLKNKVEMRPNSYKGLEAGRGAKIPDFSRSSRLRLILKLLNCGVVWKTMITLTEPGISGLVEKDGRNSKKNLKAFIQNMKDYFGEFSYVWVMEFQRRGAVHYHLITDIHFDSFSGTVFDEKGTKKMLDSRFSDTWRRLKGTSYGFHQRACLVEKLKSSSAAVKYFWQEIGKEFQKSCPSDYENPGRFWAFSYDCKLGLPIVLDTNLWEFEEMVFDLELRWESGFRFFVCDIEKIIDYIDQNETALMNYRFKRGFVPPEDPTALPY